MFSLMGVINFPVVLKKSIILYDVSLVEGTCATSLLKRVQKYK